MTSFFIISHLCRFIRPIYGNHALRKVEIWLVLLLKYLYINFISRTVRKYRETLGVTSFHIIICVFHIFANLQ